MPLRIEVFEDPTRIKQASNSSTHVIPIINQIGWESLNVRRLPAKTSMFFKILYNPVNISFPPCAQPAFYIARHDHQLKYNIPAASMEAYRFSFYPRAIRLWNQIQAVTAVPAPSVATFKDAALPAIQVTLPPPGSRLL